MTPAIRISCAALCRIEIDGKFLLEINKNRGDVLTPIGGALEFEEEGRGFLDSLNAEFEKGMDLRLTIPANNVVAFRAWFERKEHRETSPLRELREELIDEHRVLPSWSCDLAEPIFLRHIEHEEETTRKDRIGALTRYFYEIFEVKLPAELEDACRVAAGTDSSRLRLLTRQEALSGSPTKDGLKIALTSKFVIES